MLYDPMTDRFRSGGDCNPNTTAPPQNLHFGLYICDLEGDPHIGPDGPIIIHGAGLA